LPVQALRNMYMEMSSSSVHSIIKKILRKLISLLSVSVVVLCKLDTEEDAASQWKSS
jgi:uncharacterized membrane protein